MVHQVAPSLIGQKESFPSLGSFTKFFFVVIIFSFFICTRGYSANNKGSLATPFGLHSGCIPHAACCAECRQDGTNH